MQQHAGAEASYQFLDISYLHPASLLILYQEMLLQLIVWGFLR